MSIAITCSISYYNVSKAETALLSKGRIEFQDPNTGNTTIVMDAEDHTLLKNNIDNNIQDINILKTFKIQQEALNTELQNSDVQLQNKDVELSNKDLQLDSNITNLNDRLTADDGLDFQFSTDGEGSYGFLGADGSFIPFNSSKLEKINILSISTTQNLHERSLEPDALIDGTVVFNSDFSKSENVVVSNSQYLDLTITVDKPFKLAFIRTPYSRTGAVYNPQAFRIEDYTSYTVTRDTSGWTYIPFFPKGDVSPEYSSLTLDKSFNLKLYSYEEHTGMSELEIYGYYENGTKEPLPLSPNGFMLEKINITNISSKTSLETNGADVTSLYDGKVSFDSNTFHNDKTSYANSSYMELDITVDKPFKLAYIRTPYAWVVGVGNPLYFTVGDYTSPTMTRVQDSWTTIPYVSSDNNLDFLSLGTTFTIKLFSTNSLTGMSEIEIYGYYDDEISEPPVYSPSGLTLEKVHITNITPVNTINSNCGGANVLYDGDISFNFNNLQRDKLCYTETSYMELDITVDKPFKLAYIRTPYEWSAGVYNPISFTIGGYTSPVMTRIQDSWTTIPYVPSNNKFEYPFLGTTFRIRLNSGQSLTGMTELEIYGYYK